MLATRATQVLYLENYTVPPRRLQFAIGRRSSLMPSSPHPPADPEA